MSTETDINNLVLASRVTGPQWTLASNYEENEVMMHAVSNQRPPGSQLTLRPAPHTRPLTAVCRKPVQAPMTEGTGPESVSLTDPGIRATWVTPTHVHLLEIVFLWHFSTETNIDSSC